MLFSSLQFCIFFIVVYTIYLFLKNRGSIYFIFLLVSSYFFYMSWNPSFIIILIFTTLLDYTIGRLMQKTSSLNKRKFLVFLSVISNLGLLAFFKYTNFFLNSVNEILLLLGNCNYKISNVNIPLPVGISFFTFKSMSYTIDVYRRNLEAERSLLKFSTFVGFFPELVAGPIVRAAEILPQFNRFLNPSPTKFSKGLKQFILGFFKKLLIADTICSFSDNVFAHVNIITPYESWIGALAYSIQIYCDFSGYTDMAIGIAKMMDYDFPENFNLPYISKDITEFWRRWHMSLSFWFRDYLYIPLGGNRVSVLRNCINLLIVFLISGLWHGANWTFVFWGALHGIFTVVHFLWKRTKRKLSLEFLDKNFIWNTLALTSTLLFVVFSWVFFRAPNFQVAIALVTKMLQFRFTGIYYIPQFYFLLSLVVAGHVFYPILYKNGEFIKHPVIEKFIYSYMLIMLIILAPTHTSPFIYFQF